MIEHNAEYLERRWEHLGIECAILRHPRLPHKNGYVRLPEGLEVPMDEDGYPDLQAHGEITYGPDYLGWIGFDTAHYSDVWPEMPDPRGINDMYMDEADRTEWDDEMLAREVEDLAMRVWQLSSSRDRASS